LEDVFVPLYFFHRYQTEGAIKVVGGLDYNYAVKGGGQFTTKVVDANAQKETLKSILKTIDAEFLAIPKNKLDLFPPRAYAYGRSRESFKGKTGVGFDALSVTATASDMTLSLLLHPERANRLVQQKSLDKNQPGLDGVLQDIIDNTFKKNYNDSYLSEIQQMTNVNVLKHIMNLAVNDAAYFQVNAMANAAISNISRSLDSNNMSASYKSQYKRLIREFHVKPEKFVLKSTPKLPDGSPIGSGICNYLLN
jgi:hypothetical protein